jgi:hypothetical protein
MALADYFRRSAVATAQVLGGYDEDAIRERVEAVTVGLSVDADAAGSREGAALADMTVRLLARLYPVLVLDAPEKLGLAGLARAINPNIEVSTGADSAVAVAIGNDVGSCAPVTIHAGSDGFTASVGTEAPLTVGTSGNPFGPGVAACLAVANVFRHVFLGDREAGRLDKSVTLSALDLGAPRGSQPTLDRLEIGEVVLVGAGAIGHGAAWALARAPLEGRLHVVDHERLDLGNLQRYVLAQRSDVGREKAQLVAQALPAALDVRPHACDWQHFCAAHGYAWERVLVGVDSAAARRAVQATLPRWIANAWTQPGDLGVSVHPWTDTGACLACLYLPRGAVPNEDEIIARALGLEGHELEVRRLLHTGLAVPRALLAEIGQALGVGDEALGAFDGRPLRDLYTEGVCGGALISLADAGRPARDVHVPVAHQSALAGILLAARLVADALGHGPTATEVARLDVLQALGQEQLAHPAAKDARGICICQDADYRRAYDDKWAAGTDVPPAGGQHADDL